MSDWYFDESWDTQKEDLPYIAFLVSYQYHSSQFLKTSSVTTLLIAHKKYLKPFKEAH